MFSDLNLRSHVDAPQVCCPVVGRVTHRSTRSLLVVLALVGATALAGCSATAFRPGEADETGRAIHLKATVLDLLAAPLYPGLEANLWAFCLKPADPDDAVSAAAIEYLPDQMVDDGHAGHHH